MRPTIQRSSRSLWMLLVATVLFGQSPFTNRDMQAVTLGSGAGSLVLPFVADPADGGGDLFDIVSSDAGVTATLMLPDGTELDRTKAQSLGFDFEIIDSTKLNGATLVGPLTVPGIHTLIRLPAGSKAGSYAVKLNPGSIGGTALVVASYFSSSGVRAGLFVGKPTVQIGDKIAFSGLVFDGGKPLTGAKAVLTIADPRDASKTPVQIDFTDAGPLHSTVGDGGYTAIFAPTAAGKYTAAMRVTGVSATGVRFARTASTAFTVRQPMAHFVSFQDTAIDDNGDGVIDRVLVTAKVNVTAPGKYQFGISLGGLAGAVIKANSSTSLNAGDQQVTAEFAPAAFARLGQDGPYTRQDAVLVFLDDPEIPEADMLSDAGPSAPYALSSLTAPKSGLLSIDSTRLDFGTVTAGSSKDLTVILRNKALFPVSEAKVSVNNVAFSVASLPVGVDAAGSRNVAIRFAPSAPGTYAAILNIAGANIALSGSGAAPAPAIDISPLALDFGTVAAGQTKDLSLTVRNTGADVLSVAPRSISGGTFTLTSPSGAFMVPVGGLQIVTIHFAPRDATAQTATLSLFTNDPARSIVTVDLSGNTGTSSGSPQITVSPASLVFGNVITGQTKDLTVTIGNTGKASLSVSALTVAGSGFSVVGPQAPLSIAANATATVTVRFAPTAVGAASGTLTIASNAPAKPSAGVSLSGTGSLTPASGPAIDVSPASLDFGAVTSGQTKELVLTVRNNGTAALTVNSMTSSNPLFSVIQLSTPFNVGAGSFQTSSIRFSPTAAGAQTGTLTLASNDPAKSSITVNLIGTGTAPAGGTSSVLSVDDGTYEISAGIPEGPPNIYFLNRLTPPSYPATLRSVQIMFLDIASGLKAGDAIRVLVGSGLAGGTNINGASLLGAATRVGAVGQLNGYDTPAITIQSGDFLVGFATVNAPNTFPGAIDTTPPSRQRSYMGFDGLTFSLLDTIPGFAGNLGIRAVVDLGTAGPSSVSGGVAGSFEFESVDRKPVQFGKRIGFVRHSPDSQ